MKRHEALLKELASMELQVLTHKIIQSLMTQCFLYLYISERAKRLRKDNDFLNCNTNI